MIVLKIGTMRMTYESKVGDLHTHRKCYDIGDNLVYEEMMPKDEAFDQIQNCINAGWKQGA